MDDLDSLFQTGYGPIIDYLVETDKLAEVCFDTNLVLDKLFKDRRIGELRYMREAVARYFKPGTF